MVYENKHNTNSSEEQMSFVIFDTEYTTWEGCLKHGWNNGRKKEIVQISALKVSENLEILQEFNVLCQPTINPILSEYFINLTHITNDLVEKNGIPFASAYCKFKDFAGKDVCYSHSWGADFLNQSDGLIIKENMALYNLTLHDDIIYRNIAPIFAELYKNHRIQVKSQSSGQIVEILGISEKLQKLKLDKHNALYDVYSILEGLKYFYPQSTELLKKSG